MIPAFLITLREVIEASLVVATILGILYKTGDRDAVRTVFLAAISAFALSCVLIASGSLLGFNLARLYTGRVEEATEGMLMIVSATFITYAVFFLHKHFSRKKITSLIKINEHFSSLELKGLFFLTFSAVVREGVEIALFLSTVYFSSSPTQIISGFFIGVVGGLALAMVVIATSIRLPLYTAFQTTSTLLVLFAGGLLARGVQELTEAGALPHISTAPVQLFSTPYPWITHFSQAILGINSVMTIPQITVYILYVGVMFWALTIKYRKLTLS